MYYAYRTEDGDYLSEEAVEQSYRENLDEVFEGPLADTYGAARILEAVDPIAYRVGLSDYSSEYEEVSFDTYDEYAEALGEA